MALLMLPTCKLWILIVVGGLEQASPANVIFLSIVKVKACWRTILTWCLKNWMQKDKDKWSLDRLSWKRWTHSLMKWFISCPSALCISMAIGIKWCPSWSPLYLRILVMVLSFVVASAGQLMTFKAIVYCVGSVTTTSATKIWFSWVM
jgi:hypothetical protein